MPRLAVSTRYVFRESLAWAGVPFGHLWLTCIVVRATEPSVPDENEPRTTHPALHVIQARIQNHRLQ